MALLTLEGSLGATDALVQNFLLHTFPMIADGLNWPVFWACVIYFGFYCGAVYGSHISFSLWDFCKRIFTILMVLSTLHWHNMASKIYNLFFTMSEGMAATIMAGQKTATLIDALFKNVQAVADALRSVSWYQVALIFDGIVLFLLNCILFVIAFVHISVAKYVMAGTMLFLPLVAALALFDLTRGYIAAWLNVMFTYSFLYVLVVLVVRMGFFTFGDVIQEAGALAGGGVLNAMKVSSQLVTQLVIAEAVLVLLMLGVKSWAMALGNGAVASSGALGVIARGIKASLGMK